MIGSELISRVERIVEDPSFSATDILSYLNEGMMVVAGGGDRPHPLPRLAPLPDLLNNSTVTCTSTSRSVPLPSTFHRGVKSVIDADGYRLKKLDSMIEYMEKYPKLDQGSIERYVPVGNKLYYAPSKNTGLDVWFYRKPVDMTTSDSPDGLPEQYHAKLLVSYAAREIFALIEDGGEGRTPNTDRWHNVWMGGLSDLDRFIGPEEYEDEEWADCSHSI